MGKINGNDRKKNPEVNRGVPRITWNLTFSQIGSPPPPPHPPPHHHHLSW